MPKQVTAKRRQPAKDPSESTLPESCGAQEDENAKEQGQKASTQATKTFEKNTWGKDLGGNLKSDDAKPPPPEHTPESIWPSLNAEITLQDYWIMVCFFIAALLIRMYKLAWPAEVVFDELHYINFANWTLQGKFYFDVNPYFGKIVIAVLAYLFGYDPDILLEPSPGAPFPNEKLAFTGRLPAALLGSATVPIFYRLCRQLRLSRTASSFGAFCILLDTMSIIQARMIMVDIILVFFTCSALLCALVLWDAKKIARLKGPRHARLYDFVNIYSFLLLAGGLSGLSVSVRWTAFATPLTILFVSMFGIPPFCPAPLNMLDMILLVASMFGGYIGSFALLFSMVPASGSGDGFMSEDFQACLRGSPHSARGCHMNYWQRFVELNTVIMRYAKNIRGNDKWGSSWYQWIANWRGALYYRKEIAQNAKRLQSMIYVVMNPAMVFLINLFMVGFLVAMCFSIRYRKVYRIGEAKRWSMYRGTAMLLAWILSMLPTMVVYRSGPVYQYLPGLFFAQALASIGFDMLPRKLRPYALMMSIVLMAASFVYWSPWVYASPLSAEEHIERRWLPRWD